MNWFSPEERFVKMGPTSSSGVNRVGDLWFFGTKVCCGPVMNYSIVGMESGGLRLIRASSIWGDQRRRRRATGRRRAALEVKGHHSQEQAAGICQMSQMWKCSMRWMCFFLKVYHFYFYRNIMVWAEWKSKSWGGCAWCPPLQFHIPLNMETKFHKSRLKGAMQMRIDCSRKMPAWLKGRCMHRGTMLGHLLPGVQGHNAPGHGGEGGHLWLVHLWLGHGAHKDTN